LACGFAKVSAKAFSSIKAPSAIKLAVLDEIHHVLAGDLFGVEGPEAQEGLAIMLAASQWRL